MDGGRGVDDPELGLALGGGGAFGAAHVGVLKALRDRRIRPGVVAGTSAGALVGAVYAAGLPTARIEQLVTAATWSTFGRFRLTPRLGLLDSSALIDTIDRLGGRPRIEDLPRRFAAVATDVRTRRQVMITSGPLGPALRASIAVPGLFPPVVAGGRVLVDGGLAANLPIRAARSLGARTVIAVRLRPEWEFIPAFRSAEAIARLERRPDVVMIRPDLAGMSEWSRSDVARLIEAGYREASRVLDTVSLSPGRAA